MSEESRDFLCPFSPVKDDQTGEPVVTQKAMRVALPFETGPDEKSETKEWLPKSVIEVEDDKVWIPGWKLQQIESKLRGGRLVTVDSRVSAE